MDSEKLSTATTHALRPINDLLLITLTDALKLSIFRQGLVYPGPLMRSPLIRIV